MYAVDTTDADISLADLELIWIKFGLVDILRILFGPYVFI
jgi:hypothetical protein